MPPFDEKPIVKSTTAARSGVTGHNVRYVLIISFSAAAIALAVVWYFVS